MHINDALIDFANGAPIAQGQIQIIGSGPMTPMTPHNYVRLDFLSAGLLLNPIAKLKKLEGGFCATTLTKTEVLIQELSLEVFQRLAANGVEGEVLVQRTGKMTVYSWRRAKDYRLALRKTADGLWFKISGPLVAAGSTEEVTSNDGDDFVADGLISWATLVLKDYDIRLGNVLGREVKVHGLPVAEVTDAAARDPRKLTDLMIAEGLHWPYVPTTLKVPGPVSPTNRVKPMSTTFMCAHIQSERLYFNDHPYPELLSNGFFRTGALGGLWIHFEMFGKRYLSDSLTKEMKIELVCGGSGIGRITRPTGYGGGHGDPYGSIIQPIKSMTLSGTLEERGMMLVMDGTSDGFEPKEFELHKKHRNCEMTPWPTFKLEALLPWALLLARDFQVAKRWSEFERTRL